MQDKNLNDYPSDVRIAGLEMLFNLLISSQTDEQKAKFSATALEPIKVIKLSPDEVRVNGLEDYLANVLERAIEL
ncbi:hypothetical protein [Providencia manganoxydans]|uniref:hypothetical protein n=1 Tax=Providencia manganoxydans TaxID=2923283 RepID=UPI0034E51863